MIRLTVLLVLAAAGEATGHVEEPSCPAGRGEECVNQGTLSDDHVALLQTRATMHSSQDPLEATPEPETKIIKVTFDSEEEVKQAGLKVEQALKEAGLDANEWAFDGFTGKPTEGKKIEFPLVVPYKVHRIAGDESLEAVSDQEQEEHQDVSEEEMTEEEMEVFANFENETYDEEEEMRKKSKNKKQKKWASRAISKLEGEVCNREVMNKYAARTRSSWVWNWWNGCSGGDQEAFVCYKPCASGWHGISFLCHWNCPSGYEDTMSTCNRRCSIAGLEHLNTHCGLLYCSSDSGACAHRVAKIALSFIDMMANFIPGGKAMTALKKAAKAGSKAAMKAAIKKAAKSVAKKMLGKAKKNLKKYMKDERKELSEELKDAILTGGIEELTEVTVAKTQTGALADAALEMVKAVDPTGISDVVEAFEADSCNDKIIGPMPEDGLEDESATYCNRPSWWCSHGGASYHAIDCDGDGLSDPYCAGPGSSYGYLPSTRGCVETWAHTPCPACPEGLSGNGASYRGCQRKTRSGKTCQSWTSQSPHKHTRTHAGDHNYCRNPDGEPTIWCYTETSTRWEYCSPER